MPATAGLCGDGSDEEGNAEVETADEGVVKVAAAGEDGVIEVIGEEDAEGL